MCKRNQWFQRWAVRELVHRNASENKPTSTLFAYSYAAADLFAFGRSQGWKTVLGQIDPGPVEERIVARLYEATPIERSGWQPAPIEHWDSWRKECELADRVVVNSEWSFNALVEEGVPTEKIRVVPLAFEGSPEARMIQREYPMSFSRKRPMRVLFLGQINLRKGIMPLLEASRLLREEPVEFWFVGPIQIVVPEELKQCKQMHWVGPVARSETFQYYRQADLFVLPTFSDGFGMTQLEAQASNLPVVASRFCGGVVRDGVNGVLLDDVSSESLASVFLDFVRKPWRLRDLAAHSGLDERFGLDSLSASLLNLF